VYGDFGGGTWLVCVTRRSVRVHRLTSNADLHGQVAALVGLLRDRETPVNRWEPAAARLGRTLLGPAIAELPSRIQQLVIVSDGELHRLPFEALRPGAGLPRLGEQFAITLVPSATLWLRLRTLQTGSVSRTALVLADPEVSRGSAASEMALSPLPWARREARAIASTLQMEASQIREGAAASESFLKRVSLQRVSVLHLAAHARADEAFPDRSAVFLAPGDAADDGRLQPKEIAALQLHGGLVVLSACESAAGVLVSGEGLLSLARAFFAGGAGGVVATRWPLRDDDAAFVMGRFYRALGSGLGAAAALRRARREAIDHGLPAAAWAGLVLLGDGLRPPLGPSTPPAFASSHLAIGAAVVVLASLAAITGRMTRRRHSHTG
jgi:CHAT domain-containing protein